MTAPTSSAVIQPYLFFSGRCEEALELYRSALGAEIEMLMRYKDSPEQPPDGMLSESFQNKVMHCSFRIGSSVLMGSDGCGEAEPFSGFSLSVTLPDEAAAQRAFDALSEGGKVTMPLGKTFWSPCFGMLTDRFGLGWMVSIPA